MGTRVSIWVWARCSRHCSPVSGNGSRPIQYRIVLFGQAAVFGSRKLFPPQYNSRRSVALARSYHNGSQYNNNNNNVLYLFTFIFRTKFMDFRVYLRVCVCVCTPRRRFSGTKQYFFFIMLVGNVRCSVFTAHAFFDNNSAKNYSEMCS